MYPALTMSCSKHSDWVLLQRNDPNLLQLQSLAIRAKKMLKEKKSHFSFAVLRTMTHSCDWKAAVKENKWIPIW